MKILVDMDDVLVNTLSAWVEWLNEHHSLCVAVDDIAQWDMKYAFPQLTNEQIHKPLLTDYFWSTVTAKPDAKAYLERLIKEGHDIFVVTASNYVTLKAKMERCLLRNFPFLSWDNVIITYHKQLISGDVLIDDKPDNLIGGQYARILFTASHNRKFSTSSNGMFRANNWSDVYEILTTFQQ